MLLKLSCECKIGEVWWIFLGKVMGNPLSVFLPFGSLGTQFQACLFGETVLLIFLQLSVPNKTVPNAGDILLLVRGLLGLLGTTAAFWWSFEDLIKANNHDDYNAGGLAVFCRYNNNSSANSAHPVNVRD